MSDDGRLIRALVTCYPAGWRRRYGDEYAQLLRDLGIHRRPGLILDSLLGAVRAHGGVLMTRNRPMNVAVWAAGLFTVAGVGFAKLAEDFSGFAGGIYALLVSAAAVALLALVVAAAPTAVALVRGGHGSTWKYVAVPIVGAAVWYGVLRLALAVSDGHGVHSAPNVAGFVLIAVTGTAVVAATAWAACEVLRSVPTAPPARLRRVALTTIPAAMAVTTVSAVVWGLQVRSADPAGFSGDRGILATSFVVSWSGVVGALAAATVLASLASRRRPPALQ
jgi:hypothetical protein